MRSNLSRKTFPPSFDLALEKWHEWMNLIDALIIHLSKDNCHYLSFMCRCSCFGNIALCHKGWQQHIQLDHQRESKVNKVHRFHWQCKEEEATWKMIGSYNRHDFAILTFLHWDTIPPAVCDWFESPTNRRKMVRQILALQTVYSVLKSPECRMISPWSVSPSQNSAEQRGI